MTYDLYVAGRGDRCRYVLGRSGRRPLLAIGLNPSTATREKSDPTVTKVERVARLAGFDGFTVLNLYPQRSTRWRELPTRADPYAYRRNLREIEAQIAAAPRAPIWAAWGAEVRARRYLVAAARAVLTRTPNERTWLRFGPLTSTGHPRHPSRASYAWALEPFDVGAYLGILA